MADRHPDLGPELPLPVTDIIGGGGPRSAPSSTHFALSVACPECGCGPNIPCILKYTETEPHVARCRLASGLEPLPAPLSAETVDHPAHYGGEDDPYEAIKVMEAWHGPEPVYWFCTLSAEKYLSRMGKKPGEPMVRDAKKAAWYLAYAAKMREKIEAKK